MTTPSRRDALLGLAGALTLPLVHVSAAAAAEPYATPALIEAARKEGKLTLYTTNWVENEQELIKAFNAKYPDIVVDVIRATGGQMFTRVQAEGATGRLEADVVDLDGRVSATGLADLFADYAPPNAADYAPSDVVAGKFWPRSVYGWAIGYNSALLNNPPNSWKALAEGPYKDVSGHVQVTAGASGWVLALFQRKEVGEDFWAKLAANKPKIYASSPQLSSALVRGEIQIAPVLTNGLIPNGRKGAPVAAVLPSEGVPVLVAAAGISRTAPHPNAARLFLNWALSAEGQALWVETQGGFSVRKGAPLPAGVAPGAIKLWQPDDAESDALRPKGLDEWAKLFGAK
ncbi:extracellular solute-binding protein [Bosea caraganae]|uniref:Extracellular solute-binding protein n=1 Tax=Bosea caraganae TaxID=2763117 RepID=A0A370L2N0_9HYPH|nr:extracellular solute-binding protein [Bosea caraganae]RDJ22421.1 extracellular solute-binding protein [Bosea caraganae]RDJ30380.1 extracellular solute-binding protein [Bosea caraganae]